MEHGDWSLIIAVISLCCTIIGLIFSFVKIRNERINFEKQLNAQQQLIGILREQVIILKEGLEKNDKDSDWAKNYKERELELKRKRDEWARMKDMTNFLKYAFKSR